MKIIITERFQKKEYAPLEKYFSLEDFALKLRKTPTVFLKDPYFKVRLFLGWVAFRGVVMRTKWGNLVPLMIALKKSKEGENIIWNTYKREILEKQDRALKDVQEGRYREV